MTLVVFDNQIKSSATSLHHYIQLQNTRLPGTRRVEQLGLLCDDRLKKTLNLRSYKIKTMKVLIIFI